MENLQNFMQIRKKPWKLEKKTIYVSNNVNSYRHNEIFKIFYDTFMITKPNELTNNSIIFTATI